MTFSMIFIVLAVGALILFIFRKKLQILVKSLFWSPKLRMLPIEEIDVGCMEKIAKLRRWSFKQKQKEPSTLTVDELKEILRKNGHVLSGKKADLIERVVTNNLNCGLHPISREDYLEKFKLEDISEWPGFYEDPLVFPVAVISDPLKPSKNAINAALRIAREDAKDDWDTSEWDRNRDNYFASKEKTPNTKGKIAKEIAPYGAAAGYALHKMRQDNRELKEELEDVNEELDEIDDQLDGTDDMGDANYSGWG